MTNIRFIFAIIAALLLNVQLGAAQLNIDITEGNLRGQFQSRSPILIQPP